MRLLPGMIIFFNVCMLASGYNKNNPNYTPKTNRLSGQVKRSIIEDQNNVFTKSSTNAPGPKRKARAKQVKIALQSKIFQSFRGSSRSPSPKR